MSSLLVELTANIVSSHAASIEMSSDDLLQEIQRVYAALKNLESDTAVPEDSAVKETATKINPKKSIQKDQISCLICGKSGFKTLTRHLKQAHGIKPAEYRKQFGLPPGTALAAKNYSESRRQAAIANNLGEKLAKGRATHLANLAAQKAVAAKPAKTAKPKAPKAKTAVPAAAKPRAKKK